MQRRRVVVARGQPVVRYHSDLGLQAVAQMGRVFHADACNLTHVYLSVMILIVEAIKICE
jgi:hypothetical protein